MIDEYYKNFKVRDYMNNETLSKSSFNNCIDCSLGTNPFIEEDMIKRYLSEYNCEINKYPSLQYELLKEELLEFWKEHIYSNTDKNNISFGSGTMGILRNLSQFLIGEGTKVLGIAPRISKICIGSGIEKRLL